MGLQQGELVLGRFEVIEALPSWGELRRYSARDTATGKVVDLQQPAAEVRIRPGASERFRAATAGLPAHPALSRPLAAGEHKGSAVAAYPQAVAWERHGPLDHGALRQLAGWLGSGAAAASGALGGALRPEDLAIRPDGTPVVQPTGVQPKASRAVPDPFRPPGDGTPQDGALYGLGLLLFEAATGSPPFSPKTLSDLARQQGHPPRAKAVRPDIPDELDALIAALMSPEPAARRAALPHLQASAPPQVSVEDAAPPPRSGVPVEELGLVVTREPTQRGARRDVPLDAWVVEADLSGVPETLRRRLAAVAGLPDAALARAVAEGVPLPVASAGTEAEANALAASLSGASVHLSVVPSSRRSPLVLGGLGVAAMGLFGLVAVGGLAALGVISSLALLLPSLALAGLVLVSGIVGAGIGSLRSGVTGQIRRGHRIVSDAYPAPAPLEARMQDARRALLTSELSKPAQVDLLSALDALQEALPSAERADEQERVSAAVEDIIRTASAASRGGADATKAIEDAARRAQAARTAARELR